MLNPLFYILFSLISGFFLAKSYMLFMCVFAAALFFIFKKKYLFSLALVLSFLSGYILSFQGDYTKIDEGNYSMEFHVERSLRYDYISSSQSILFLLKTDNCLFEGDRVYGKFRISEIGSKRDYDLYLRESGVIFNATVIEIDSVKSVRGIERIRTMLINRVKTVYPEEKLNGFINSFLWGYRKDLDSDIKKGFLHTGIIHLIAISGQHTTIIFAFFAVILYLLPINKKMKIVLSLLGIMFYGALTYFNPPVMRAVIFLIIIYAGRIFSSDADNENMLIITMIFMLVLNRRNFNDEGFMLSFMAVYCIFVSDKLVKSKNEIIRLLFSSLMILLITFPYMMLRFKYISIGSPVFTIILLPLFNTLLPLSLISIIPGLSFLSYLVNPIFIAIKFIVENADKLPLFYNFSIDALMFVFLESIVFLSINKKYKTAVFISAVMFLYVFLKI